MKIYGQYCPIARASEILAERWTLIIVRNLLAGCRTFSELYEGRPRHSQGHPHAAAGIAGTVWGYRTTAQSPGARVLVPSHSKWARAEDGV